MYHLSVCTIILTFMAMSIANLHITKNTFNLDKMKYKLDDIVTKILSDVPKEVGLKLPKLKKAGVDTSKVKLPKLKKA